FFLYARLGPTENCSSVRFAVEEPVAIERRNKRHTGDDSRRRASQRRHTPDFAAAEIHVVVDLCTLRRKAVDSLVLCVVGELQRVSSGCQHDEYLLDAAHWRRERYSASIG